MMGHIHNLLLGMVRENLGEEGVAQVFKAAKMEKTVYKTEVVYPEGDWQRLYNGTKEVYGVDDDGAQKIFADYFMQVSPKLFPAIFKRARNARNLFEGVPLIHKQWPSAASQKDFKEKLWVLPSDDPNRLVFKYDSPNRLCGVLKYVAEGVLKYYGESAVVTETRCVNEGSRWCEVEIRWNGAGDEGTGQE